MRFLYLNAIDYGNPFLAFQLLQAQSIQTHWHYTNWPIVKNHLICLTVLFLFSTSQLLAQSSPIYVDQQVSGNNTGQNWADAYIDLQDAIVEAQYGDTIWVAQGIYKPTTSNDRKINFSLKNGVALIGGFQGDETTIDQRDVNSYETILTGDIGAIGDSLDNSYHVIYALGVDSTTLLDGFTITAGVANFEDPSFSSTFLLGGGILLDTNDDFPISNPVIQNCIFINNTAWRGGGLYIKSSEKHQAYPSIKHCLFKRNSAQLDGGGVTKFGDKESTPPLSFIGCSFIQNRAGATGGGLFLSGSYINAEVDSSSFKNNESQDLGGGIAFYLGLAEANVRIRNSMFISNKGSSGGAIEITILGVDFQGLTESAFYLQNCLLENNQARNDKGGAIATSIVTATSFLTIENCTLKENWSFNRGGAIQLQSLSTGINNLTVHQSKFINNRSSSGVSGGIRAGASNEFFSGDIQVKNSLFIGNTGALTFLNNKGIITAKVHNSTFINNGTIGPTILKKWPLSFTPDIHRIDTEIANCIFWNPPNIPLEFIFNNNTLENPTMYGFNLHHNLISTDACDLPGGEEACQENNLFNVHPQFRDSLNGDFRLAGCSPAINAGINTLVTTETDLAGQPRVLEGRVDLGAYEQELFDLDVTSVQVKEISCWGEQDGQIEVSTTGTLPLQYDWTNAGLAGMGNEQLSPGLYAVTVTDSLNCQESLFIQVDEPDSLQATFSLIPSANEQMNGSITLEQVLGGRPPYQWTWSTGDNTPSLTHLLNGTYALTLTDRNGCTQQWNFDLALPDATTSLKSGFEISIFPNPIQSERGFTIQYNLPSAQRYTFSLIDPIGQQLMQQSHRLKGIGQLVWPSVSAAEGIYFLQVSSATGEVLALQKLLLVE